MLACAGSRRTGSRLTSSRTSSTARCSWPMSAGPVEYC
jgi:hypothetical protein